MDIKRHQNYVSRWNSVFISVIKVGIVTELNQNIENIIQILHTKLIVYSFIIYFLVNTYIYI